MSRINEISKLPLAITVLAIVIAIVIVMIIIGP